MARTGPQRHKKKCMIILNSYYFGRRALCKWHVVAALTFEVRFTYHKTVDGRLPSRFISIFERNRGPYVYSVNITKQLTLAYDVSRGANS